VQALRLARQNLFSREILLSDGGAALMSQKSYILFGALLVALIVLGELYGTTQPMNIWEFFGWVGGK
jgi:hypothetical protein